jgi:hypothetical protein
MFLFLFIFILVDTFFMKTCRFGGAEPRPLTQGLFCKEKPPQEQYLMIPCGIRNCPCCHSLQHHQNTNSIGSPVDFTNSSQHRFINGYVTYLNSPAVCSIC